MDAKYMGFGAGWNFSQRVAGKILKNKLFKFNCFFIFKLF
jgi:hypothetical protein